MLSKNRVIAHQCESRGLSFSLYAQRLILVEFRTNNLYESHAGSWPVFRYHLNGRSPISLLGLTLSKNFMGSLSTFTYPTELILRSIFFP